MRASIVILAALALGGCVSIPTAQTVLPADSHPKAAPDFPRRLAVLPVNNMAGDTDGSLILRALVVHKLDRDLGFLVQNPQDTDATIRDRTLTGSEIPLQVVLSRQNASILASWLGVDGLLHSELLAFNRAKLTLYVRSQVKVHFWLTNHEGKKIWDMAKDSDSGGLNLGGGGGSAEIEAALNASGIPTEAADRLRASPLAGASMDVVDDAFATFPK